MQRLLWPIGFGVQLLAVAVAILGFSTNLGFLEAVLLIALVASLAAAGHRLRTRANRLATA